MSLDLQKITRVAILSPIVGIITNLSESEKESLPLEEALISTGGFDAATTQFLCNIDWKKGKMPL